MNHPTSPRLSELRVRPYDGSSGADLARMVALLQTAWHPARAPSAHYHPGDLFWRLREPSYEKMLWLWEEASGGGDLLGFAEWEPGTATLEVQVGAGDGVGLRAHMLAWAEEQVPGAAVTTYAAEHDRDAEAVLTARGYTRKEAEWVNGHLRRLDAEGPIEAPVLPEGYVVRHLRSGPAEVDARIRGHRAGWESTKMTEELYGRLQRTPGYRPELDIVVEGPGDGAFAATANCWLDEQSGAGLFEPVSTDPAHRRNGLARALVLFGLAQLRALGATTAWVASVAQNPAATALYESCGMPVARRDLAWIKPGA